MADNEPIPTLTFEGVKVTMHQTREGIKVTLVIHPNDIPPELLTDPVGSRYRVVMVLLDAQDQPDPRGKVRINEALKAAVLLSKDTKFQLWCLGKNMATAASEEDAAEAIRTFCGITSRADLATSYRALDRFNVLRLEYSKTIPED